MSSTYFYICVCINCTSTVLGKLVHNSPKFSYHEYEKLQYISHEIIGGTDH